MRREFENGIAWGEAKKQLFELVDAELAEARDVYDRLMQDPGHVEAVLQRGAERARDHSAALLEKVLPKTTTETSEATSSSNDEEKGTDAKSTAKSGTSSSSTTKTSSAKPLPDAVAAVAQLDVQHRFALVFLLEVVRDAYIAVGDCLAKNKGKLVAPRGEGGNAMSMF